MAVQKDRRFGITAFFRVYELPEEGSNAETSVVLYRHLASIKYILTFTCKLMMKTKLFVVT